MDTKDRVRRLLDEIVLEIKKGGAGAVARFTASLGVPPNYLRKRRQRGHLDCGDLFAIADALGKDPARLVARAEGRARRASLAEFVREAERLQGDPSPVLEWIGTRFEQGTLLDVPLPEAADLAELQDLSASRPEGEEEIRAWIEGLNNLSWRDSKYVARLSLSVLSLALHLEDDDRAAELSARLLGVYASSQRKLGHGVAAHRLLAAALKLARGFGLEEVFAELGQRAAYVIADRGEPEEAGDIAREVVMIYVLLDDRPRIGKALVALATMLFYVDDTPAAIAAFTAALNYLPEPCRRYRYCALQALGAAYLQAGDVALADRCAAAAAEIAPVADRSAQGSLLWLRGLIAGRRQAFVEAEDHLRAALAVLDESAEPYNVAPITVELVQVLLHRGEEAEASRVARTMFRLLGPLGRNKLVAAAIHRLMKAGMEGHLTLELAEQVAAEIERGRSSRKTSARSAEGS